MNGVKPGSFPLHLKAQGTLRSSFHPITAVLVLQSSIKWLQIVELIFFKKMQSGSGSFLAVVFVFLFSLCMSAGSAKQCYQPLALQSSNCCKNCNTFGCLVNAGRVDENTPCDPLGRHGKPTWVVCDGTGCDGQCRNCRCEEVTISGKLGIWWDLVTDKVLFYADVRDGSKSCIACGNGDGQRREEFLNLLKLGSCPAGTPDCKKGGEKCGARNECCEDDSCRPKRLGPHRCRSCLTEGTKCNDREECCPRLGCYGFNFGPRRCRTCYEAGRKCNSTDQCCEKMTCRSVRLGPARCRF